MTEASSRLARLQDLITALGVNAELQRVRKEEDSLANLQSSVGRVLERLNAQDSSPSAVRERATTFLRSLYGNSIEANNAINRICVSTFSDCAKLLSQSAAMPMKAPHSQDGRFRLGVGLFLATYEDMPIELVSKWSMSLLSVQRTAPGLRILLQGEPENGALLIVVGKQSPVVLTTSTRHATFPEWNEDFDAEVIILAPLEG